MNIFYTGSGMAEQDGGLIGAEEKVINSKNKMDENMVSRLSFACSTLPSVHWSQRHGSTSRPVSALLARVDSKGATTPTYCR